MAKYKTRRYFIIEDLHYQPTTETCIKTKYLFENWKNNNWIDKLESPLCF